MWIAKETETVDTFDNEGASKLKPQIAVAC